MELIATVTVPLNWKEPPNFPSPCSLWDVCSHSGCLFCRSSWGWRCLVTASHLVSASHAPSMSALVCQRKFSRSCDLWEFASLRPLGPNAVPVSWTMPGGLHKFVSLETKMQSDLEARQSQFCWDCKSPMHARTTTTAPSQQQATKKTIKLTKPRQWQHNTSHCCPIHSPVEQVISFCTKIPDSKFPTLCVKQVSDPIAQQCVAWWTCEKPHSKELSIGKAVAIFGF